MLVIWVTKSQLLNVQFKVALHVFDSLDVGPNLFEEWKEILRCWLSPIQVDSLALDKVAADAALKITEQLILEIVNHIWIYDA